MIAALVLSLILTLTTRAVGRHPHHPTQTETAVAQFPAGVR